MRKTLTQQTLIIILCAITTIVSAQGFYAKVGGGYNFQALKTEGLFSETKDNTITTRPSSLGQGISSAVGVGYMINSYLGFEVAAAYVFGTSNSYENEWAFREYRDISYTTKIKKSGLSIIPALKVTIPINQRFAFYTNFGISIPLTEKAIINEDGTTTKSTPEYGEMQIVAYTQKSELTSYFKLGYSVTAGVNIALTEQLNLFVEVNALMSTFETKKKTVVEATENGQDILSTMTVIQKETEYSREYTYNPLADLYLNPDMPNQQLSRFLSSSSMGIAVGLSFKF